jgi:CRISPR-associated endonuclease/helicase Cas3
MREAESMLRRGCNLHSPSTFEDYFRRVFGTVGAFLDEHNIQATRARLDFPQVSKDFRMIEDDTVPVVVRPNWGNHPAEVDQLLNAFCSQEDLPQWAFRRLQPYVVSVRRRVIPRCQEEHLVHELVPGREIWVWRGAYDRVRGLVGAMLPQEGLVGGGGD